MPSTNRAKRSGKKCHRKRTKEIERAIVEDVGELRQAVHDLLLETRQIHALLLKKPFQRRISFPN